MTFASVFHSLVFISLVKSWSTVVGLVPSKSTSTLSFFFTNKCLVLSLFRALEFAGEEIIHDQRGDKSGHPKILLRIVVQDMEFKLVTTLDQPAEQFVHPELFLIRPLAYRI